MCLTALPTALKLQQKAQAETHSGIIPKTDSQGYGKATHPLFKIGFFSMALSVDPIHLSSYCKLLKSRGIPYEMLSPPAKDSFQTIVHQMHNISSRLPVQNIGSRLPVLSQPT